MIATAPAPEGVAKATIVLGSIMIVSFLLELQRYHFYILSEIVITELFNLLTVMLNNYKYDSCHFFFK